MTAVERLEAAIVKLETIQGETWDAEQWEPHGMWAVNASNPGGGRVVVVARLGESDAQMIVTLHRTIDAQLAILRAALDEWRDYEVNASERGLKPEHFITRIVGAALAVADAILGSDS